MRRSAAVLLIALVFVPGIASSAGPGSVGIKLLEAPTNRRDDPRARIYIVDSVHPGTAITRRIGVVNNTPSTTTIALYAGAATIADGSFVPNEGRGGNDVASWTTVTPSSVTIPAGKQATADVKISVPRDASSGERYGVVWAELPGAAATGGGASVVNRVGIRIYLSITGGGEPKSDFKVDSLQAGRIEDGTPIVYAKVTNTGGRALDMSGNLALADGPGGAKAGPFPARLGTTLGIHQTEPVTIALRRELPDGPWNATIKLRSGLVERSAVARISFPARPNVTAAPVKAHPLSASRKTAAALLTALILACLGVASLFLFRGRKSAVGA